MNTEIIKQIKKRKIYELLYSIYEATINYIKYLSERMDNEKVEKDDNNKFLIDDLRDALDSIAETKDWILFDCYLRKRHLYDIAFEEKERILRLIAQYKCIKFTSDVISTYFYEMLDITINICKLNRIPKKGIIRWLKYEDKLTNIVPSTNFPIHLMNSIENVSKFVYMPLEYYLYLYKIDTNTKNHESLVFKFEYSDLPNVLFSGDTDYHWLFNGANIKKIILRQSSIVTTPHHGSSTGIAAYDSEIIQDKSGTNESLVFVRSDSTLTSGYKKRPCSKYKNMKNKYCTFCKGKKCINKRVILEYSLGKCTFKEINGNSVCSC